MKPLSILCLAFASLSAHLSAQGPPRVFVQPHFPVAFTGSGAPGAVPGNLPGDTYTDTANSRQYVCGSTALQPVAPPACTRVGTGQWWLVPAPPLLPNDISPLGGVLRHP